ncbi:glycosyltransferase [Clostridium tagluense]|uniref:glycosyltransferase n=1 Tax=Clostridium tagluense TaxID=360422 RepID=UPI001C6E09CC|nr:glycosyltransferase [Clostridium tagluense]MBW9154965.1 glycosyltransferase [Clostridium tagluense]WLC64418.1 glycosyltransferase [Clostridium tagluense]
MKLSIGMMVKNESKYLRECLESLKPIRDAIESELIIVDTGSTDNTVEIAKEFTDKVYFHKWNSDFSDMRNITIKHCTGEWILVIDGDEVISNPNGILQFFNSNEFKKHNTASVSVKNFTFTDNEDDFAVLTAPRIFRKDKDFRFEGAVHNQCIWKKPMIMLESEILHYGYINDDKELMDKKFLRTSEILKRELHKDKENVYYIYQLAVSYSMHGDYQEALETIEKAYNLVKLKKLDLSKYMAISTFLSRIYLQNGKFREVETICLEATNKEGFYIDLYYYLAKSQFSIYKNEESIETYNTYFKKLEAFNNFKVVDDLSVVHYTLGNYDDACLDMVTLYERIGKYEEALKYIKIIKSDKVLNSVLNSSMSLYTKLNKFEELRDFYYEIVINNNLIKDYFISALELYLLKANQKTKENIFKVFSEDDTEYALLNKIRLTSDNSYSKLNKEIVNLDFSNLPDYFGDVLYYLLCEKVSLVKYLEGVNDFKIKNYCNYLVLRHDNFGINLYNYLKNYENTELNLDEVRIYKILAIYLFKDKDVNYEKYSEILDKYLEVGEQYLTRIYNEDIIQGEFTNCMKDEEDMFLMYMHLANKNKNSEAVYIRYLRKALNSCNYMKQGIEILQNKIKIDVIEKENEMGLYKKKVKQSISEFIELKKFNQAKELINAYEDIIKDDSEIYSMKAVIQIQELQYDRALSTLSDGLGFDPNNFDLNYNLAYVYEIQEDFQNAIKYYSYAYNKTLNEQLRDEIKVLVKNILHDTGRNEEFEEVLSQNIHTEKCLILCHFYSVFVKEFIENMKKCSDIEFDVLTMDLSYKKDQESNLIKNIYTYSSINELIDKLNNVRKYDIIHIHYLDPMYSSVSENIKEKCNKLIVSIWGSDYYRMSSENRIIQKHVLDNADIITMANENTIKEFDEYYKFEYSSKLKVCRFGLTPLEYITKYGNEDITKLKIELDIPIDSLVVTCGYNASPAQNHLEILNSLIRVKDRLPNNLFLIFPMTYGDDNYRKNIINEIGKTGFKYKVLDKFLSNEDVAKLRIVSDIMLQVQTTDQLSGSMQEYLYCNNIIITGEWLPYKILKEKGCFFLEVEKVDNIGNKLLSSINNFEAIFDKCKNNNHIIAEFSLWTNVIQNWISIYKKQEVNIKLRKFPYPYKAIMSIASDIDYTTLYEFCEIHKFLNTSEETKMGRGLGLDIADSFWMFKSSQINTEHYIDYNRTKTASEEMSWFIGDNHEKTENFLKEEIKKFISVGWIDSLHSYGDFTNKNSGITTFKREHSIAAINELKKESIKIKVWIDHGSATNTQNFGNSTKYKYQWGDQKDKNSYHTDITIPYGIEFIWNPDVDNELGYQSAISPKILADGQKVWQFKRYTIKQNEWIWNTDKLGNELSEENLKHIETRGLYSIYAQHLGMNYEGKYSDSTIQGLRRLKDKHDNGKILVTRLSRLLEYNRTNEYIKYTVSDNEGVQYLNIEYVDDPIFGKFIPTMEQCRGITIYSKNPQNIKIYINNIEIDQKELQVNEYDGYGKSIGIKWFEADCTDYTKEILPRELEDINRKLDEKHKCQNLLTNKLEKNGWKFNDSHGLFREISDYTFKTTIPLCLEKDQFIKEDLTLNYYKRRLESIGFENKDMVLDAGCGIGNWSIALAYLNKHVEAIDITGDQILVANALIRGMKRENINLSSCNVEKLPFDNNTFDGILCRQMIMYTNIEKTLQEFYRTLKKGGKILISASSVGWYLYYIIELCLKKGDTASGKYGCEMIQRYLNGETTNAPINLNWISEIMKNIGFEVIDINGEGEIATNSKGRKFNAIKSKEFYGVIGNVDILAIKK